MKRNERLAPTKSRMKRCGFSRSRKARNAFFLNIYIYGNGKKTLIIYPDYTQLFARICLPHFFKSIFALQANAARLFQSKHEQTLVLHICIHTQVSH